MFVTARCCSVNVRSLFLLDIVILLVGLALLIVGGELVVTHGVRIASFFHISPMIVGLTVVALGTSLPELAVGIDGMRRGVGDVVLGNVVGTDIVNILLILGLAALIRPIAVPAGIISFDLPMMTASSVFFLLLARNGYLSAGNGLVLLIAGIVYLGFVIISARRRGARVGTVSAGSAGGGGNAGGAGIPGVGAGAVGGIEVTGEQISAHDAVTPITGKKTIISAILLVVGLVTIMWGADFMLRGAVAIAYSFGLSETLVGLTIVAIGTSAPELVTTIIATIKNERSLAFGNLVGSSTLNLTIILGISLLFSPNAVVVDPKLLHVSMPLMILVGLACIPVFLTGRRISRLEGGLFVAAYAAYLTYTIAVA